MCTGMFNALVLDGWDSWLGRWDPRRMDGEWGDVLEGVHGNLTACDMGRRHAVVHGA